MCTAFSPVVEVKKDDPAQCDCGEQGQGLVWIEIERDHGTDHPVQPGDGDEQAYGGDHASVMKSMVSPVTVRR